ILEIAQMSGFADYTNFVRRFKKIFGLTPTEFRRTSSIANMADINK
ncbi:MAG: AraC family transcriptional regulator, partial [Oscillospiraceae bacterium]|nr:AraC family transcriptional regulator [Oscillospiraceae bacterium]